MGFSLIMSKERPLPRMYRVLVPEIIDVVPYSIFGLRLQGMINTDGRWELTRVGKHIA
jgi:hypothetical protein